MRSNRIICRLAIGTTPGAVNGAEKTSKDGASRGFRELKEALKILESLKNMTVEQLWTGGSPTSPTSAKPASTAHVATSAAPAATEKPTKEKRFLDDIKKLQENLRKTLDNVAIVEEEKMEAGGSAGAGTEVCLCTQFWCVESKLLMWVRYFKIVSHNSAYCPITVQAERVGDEKTQQEPQTPVGGQEWPSEFLSDTPVLCQQSGGKPGVTFTSAKGEVFSVLEWAPGEKLSFSSLSATTCSLTGRMKRHQSISSYLLYADVLVLHHMRGADSHLHLETLLAG